jgi:hypothetical protein
VYDLVPLGELLDSMGPGVKSSINSATQFYLDAKQQHWQALSKCPPSCNKHGTCPKGGSSCKCPNFPCTKPFLGRMCSGGGEALACLMSYSVAPHPWTDHAGSGKLLHSLAPGTSELAFTYVEAHSEGRVGSDRVNRSQTTNSTMPFHFYMTMEVSCYRHNNGSLQTKAHAFDRTGHTQTQVGPTVNKGCSEQKWKPDTSPAAGLTSQISTCCFP